MTLNKVLIPLGMVPLAILLGFFATQPINPSSPFVFFMGLLLLALVILRPYVGILLLVTTLLLSPIYPLLSDVFTLNRAIGVVTLMGILLRKATGIDRSPMIFYRFDIGFWCFLVVVGISLLLNGATVHTRVLLLNLVMGYLFYWLLINTISDWQGVRLTLMVVVACNLGVGISTIRFALQSLDELSRYNILGGASVNLYGNLFYLSIMCLLILAETSTRRSLYYLLIPVFLVALALTGNRSGMVALGGSLLVYALVYGTPRQRFNLLLGVGVLGGVGLLLASQVSESALQRALDIPLGGSGADDNTKARLDFYRISLNLFLERPFFGVGLGSFGSHAGIYAGVRSSPHNIFLGTLAETGIFGFACLLFLYGYVLNVLWRARRLQDYATQPIPRRSEILHHTFIMVIGYNILTNLTNGHTLDRFGFVVFALALIIANLAGAPLRIGQQSVPVQTPPPVLPVGRLPVGRPVLPK